MSVIRRKWNASWIWAEDGRQVNTHVLFRADFDLAGPPPAAELYIAAESFAIVYINGELVTQTSSLSYPTQHYYEQCDVGQYLRDGINSIAILAWYIGVPSGASCPKDPGLLFEICGPDGENILASSDERIKCRVLDAWKSRQRRSYWLNLDLIETLDYRDLPEDFPMTADLSAYSVAEAQGGSNVRYIDLQYRDFPKPCGDCLDAMKELFSGTIEDRSDGVDIAHLAVTAEQNDILDRRGEALALDSDFVIPAQDPGKAWSLLIDLGDYEKGLPLMDLSGCEGAGVDISWFEHLKKLSAKETVSKVYVTDRYILPARKVSIRPEEWKCGRYLRLTFRNITSPLTVSNLRWQRQHYPLGSKLSFSSSDAKLNRIVDISLKAAAICMHDNIMDCPWRERRQWIGDAQRIGLINHYAFGDRALLRAVLAQHVHVQDVNGRMFSCLPVFEEYPTQSMEWFRAVMEYHRYTGDHSLLRQVGDNVEMLHRWFLRSENRDSNDLLRIIEKPVMNWMDNPFGSVVNPAGSIRSNQFRTAYAALNLRYLLFLDDIMEAMAILGRDWAVAQASHRRQQLEQIIVKTFMQSDTGLLRDCAETDIPVSYSEMAHSLAVLAKLPGVDLTKLWSDYCKYVEANPDAYIVRAGPFGKYNTLEAMGQLGLREDIVKEIIKWWGPMVDAGSNTSWEHFHNGGSHCHGWGGTTIVALARYIFGIDPVSGGHSRRENVAGIDWLECEISHK